MSERKDEEEQKRSENFTEIAKLIPFYPNLTDPWFAYNLARKKEFHDYALTSDSTHLPGLFRQQVIIQRFLAPETLYNELLIFHRVGAGKTATALAVGEAWKTQDRETKVCGKARETSGNRVVISDRLETPSQCPLIIVRKVDRFKKIFEDELQMRFPEYQSPDATFDNNYQMESYTSAGKKQVHDYSNRVIIIDEAHNLQPQSKKEKKTEKYETLLNLLRTGVNSKKILLTGTPIPDHASQIIPLMNLILPHLIPPLTNTRFDQIYFNENRVFIPQSTTGNSDYDLTQKFKGRVSYFRSIIPSIQRKDQGRKDVSVIDTEEKADPITIGITVPVVCDVMSPHQYEIAQASFLKARGGGVNDHFSHVARRAATMVFPHPVEEETMQAKNKNIKKQIKAMAKDDLNRLRRFSTTFYSILQDIKAHSNNPFFIYLDYVNGAGGQINFSYVLQHFLNYTEWRGGFNPDQKKYVILGLQREISAGSTWLRQTQKNPNRNVKIPSVPRLESSAAADLQSELVLSKFNAPRNIHGDDIHVLIGGQKSGEGITIKNVTRIHLIPYWNFSQSQQAIGRTIRPTSHTALIQNRICQLLGNYLNMDDVTLRFHHLVGLTREFTLEFPLPGEEKSQADYMEEQANLVDRVDKLHVKKRDGNVLSVVWTDTIKVAVFHHVAVGSRQLPYLSDYRMTQDVHVFNTAAKKYAETDQVLRFLKEISFDCPLTYPKNMVEGEKNYQCRTFPEAEIKKYPELRDPGAKRPRWDYSIPPDQLQYDTYDLYYTARAAIVTKIVAAYSNNSIISFQQILDTVGERPDPLLGALQSVIGQNYQIPNRFGFLCCLREDRDMYFLVDLRNAFRGDQKYEHAIYSALPLLTYQTSLQSLNAIRMMTHDESTGTLGTFCENPLDEQTYHKFSYNTKIRLLEGFYINKGDTPPFIISLLEKNFYRMGNTVVVHVLFPKFHTEVGSEYKTTLKYTGEMRVFDPLRGGWRDAFPAEEAKYLPEVAAQDKNKPPFEVIHSFPGLPEEKMDLEALLLEEDVESFMEEEVDSGLEDDE